jgi:hypothetical protein
MSGNTCNQCIDRSIKHFEKFIEKAQELSNISVEDLINEGGLNPYMTALLRIKSMEDAATLFVYRRLERSLGTSFGTVIEKFLADCLGGERGKDLSECKGRGKKDWICWWDVILHNPPGFQLPPTQHINNCKCDACRLLTSEKLEIKILLSIKSGPADVNKDIVMEFVRHARVACVNGYVPYLVLTYGKEAFQVAESTMRTNPEFPLDPSEHLLVGRAIFRKFLGADCYDQLIARLRTLGGVDIFLLIKKKIEYITSELNKKYNNIDEVLRKIS